MVYVTKGKIYPSHLYTHFRGTLLNKKKKSKIRCKITSFDIMDTMHQYSQNSSLHGLRYVGNKELHITERY